MACRLSARADCGQVPAVTRARQENVADQKYDEQRCRVDWNAEHAASADKIPGVAVDGVGGEHLRIARVEQVDRGAQDDQRYQRGEKRPCLEETDQETVDAAERA